jgi:hypothetical protein
LQLSRANGSARAELLPIDALPAIELWVVSAANLVEVAALVVILRE